MHSARNNTPVGGLERIMVKWQDLDSLCGHVGLGIPRNYIKAFLELHHYRALPSRLKSLQWIIGHHTIITISMQSIIFSIPSRHFTSLALRDSTEDLYKRDFLNLCSLCTLIESLDSVYRYDSSSLLLGTSYLYVILVL